MDWFKIVKKHYDAERYKKEDVKVFVENGGKITPEQYKEITGEEYVNG